MISDRSRSGKIGILATLMLMFSIVMFVGALFWLMTDPGFLLGAPGTSLFKPAPVPDDTAITLNQTITTQQSTLINDTEPQSEESETEKNPRLMETITDLTLEGCSIIILETKVYLDNPYYVDYEEFKSKALESKIVIVSPGDSNTILLVKIKNIQWIWIPS